MGKAQIGNFKEANLGSLGLALELISLNREMVPMIPNSLSRYVVSYKPL